MAFKFLLSAIRFVGDSSGFELWCLAEGGVVAGVEQLEPSMTEEATDLDVALLNGVLGADVNDSKRPLAQDIGVVRTS